MRTTPTDRARRPWVLRGALVAVLLAGGVVVGVSGTQGGGTPPAASGPVLGAEDDGAEECVAPPPRPASITDEEADAAHARLAETLRREAATGWGEVGNRHAVDGSWVCGWTPVQGRSFDEITAVAMEAAASPHGLPRTSVFDAVDGELIGFIYGARAFVPLEVATDPAVDIGALVGAP